MSGCLYIVPTPVGNMADMTPRAVEVLKQASLVLAEDTRTSAPLMQRFGIDTPMQSHHKYNEHDTSATLASRILAGENIALISDAGTPGYIRPRIHALARMSPSGGRCHHPARPHSIRSGTGKLRPAMRQIRIRGLPSSEERTRLADKDLGRGRTHIHHLRIAAATRQNPYPTGRSLRRRTPGFCKQGNFQNLRINRARNPRRTY